MQKLSSFLKPVDKNSQSRKFKNYNNAVFILLKGELEEISNALKMKEASQYELNGDVICLTFNEKKEINISKLSYLMEYHY